MTPGLNADRMTFNMRTAIAIGFSSSENTLTAFKDAAAMVKSQTNLTHHDLILVTATPAYTAPANPHTISGLDQLHKILNPERLIGMTTPVIILKDEIHLKGVAVLAISSDEIGIGIAAQQTISLLPLQETGIRFARDLASRMSASERHGAIIFCNNIGINHSLLIRGLQEGLGRAFNIAGAINPDGMFCQNQLFTDSLGGIIFGGQTSFFSSIRHGWQPLGKPRIIDDCDSNLIRSIDGKPAVSIYQDYFPDSFVGAKSVQLTGNLGDIGLLYPLGLNTSRPKDYIIKNPTAVLPDGSLVCQGEIARGTEVHLMIGDKDACRRSAHDAAVDIRDKLHGKHPRLVFIFISIARKKLFGRSFWQEIAQIKDILGIACPIFGMYTYGEIGATAASDLQIHNASILVIAIG